MLSHYAPLYTPTMVFRNTRKRCPNAQPPLFFHEARKIVTDASRVTDERFGGVEREQTDGPRAIFLVWRRGETG